jgi:hypothetical protein
MKIKAAGQPTTLQGNFAQARLGLLVLLLGLSQSCFYVPLQKALPNATRNIALLPIQNTTSQPGISQKLDEKLNQAFVVRGRMKVVPRERADVILQWSLQRYDEIALQRDSNQLPVYLRMQIMVDVDLIDAKTGNTLLTTRRTVDLTPVSAPTEQLSPGPIPTADLRPQATHTEDEDSADWDSSDVRTLVEYSDYYRLNALGHPAEDPSVVQDRVSDQMARRVMRLIVNGNGSPLPQGGTGAAGAGHQIEQHPYGSQAAQ